MQSTNKSIDILSIGNTIIDLEYNVEDALLNTLNIEKGSMTLIDLDRKTQLINKVVTWWLPYVNGNG